MHKGQNPRAQAQRTTTSTTTKCAETPQAQQANVPVEFEDGQPIYDCINVQINKQLLSPPSASAAPNSQGHTTRVKKPEKEKNFGMNEKLIELKTKWSNHIAWGELYGCLSSDQKVLQLAWKDTQIVLFMITLVDTHTTVS